MQSVTELFNHDRLSHINGALIADPLTTGKPQIWKRRIFTPNKKIVSFDVYCVYE